MSVILLSIIAGLIAVGFIFGCMVAWNWRKRRIMGSFFCAMIMLLMFMTACVILLASAGLKGYQSFTREELAATVVITPMGNQQFKAQIIRQNERDTVFAIAGDELYIDANILKWKPFINLIGMHTVYRLDRISGRYRDIRDERSKVHTVYSLAGAKLPWDLFLLWNRIPVLRFAFDAQYGSAAFFPAFGPAKYHVMVTTSGLLIRLK